MKKSHRKGKRRVGGTDERTCVVSREVAPRTSLLRWFVGPDGTHWPDWSGKGPGDEGKAKYTLPRRSIVRTAVERRLLVGAKDELYARFDSLCEQELLQRLGLATRAGALAIGQLSTDDALQSGSCRVLVVAEDASSSTVRKYSQQAGRKGIPCIRCASGEVLGKALGREFVSTLAVTTKPFARRILYLSTALADSEAFVIGVEHDKIGLETAAEKR